jgi:hypothetical protein
MEGFWQDREIHKTVETLRPDAENNMNYEKAAEGL